MKIGLLLYFLSLPLFVQAQNLTNPIKLEEGNIGFLEGQLAVSIEFNEDNLLIDDLPEKQYIENHKTERNRKKAGSGDLWEQNWTDNFVLYHKSFSAGYNNIASSGVQKGSEYTLYVRIDKIAPGFETGIDFVGKGSQIFGEVVIAKTRNPEMKLARLSIIKAKGSQKFDLKTRIDYAYYYAGYWTAATIKRALKKQSGASQEPEVIAEPVRSAPSADKAPRKTVAPVAEPVDEPVTEVVKTPAKPVQVAVTQKSVKPEKQVKPPVKEVSEEGPEFPSVKIKSQLWHAKNLDVSSFRNGDQIPEAKSSDEWKSAAASKQPAWCYLSNDPTNGSKYGKLYNWYAVNDPRGLAPDGWHVPTVDDWKILIEITLGASSELKNVFKKDETGSALKSSNGWDNSGNGTDAVGFAGYPGGGRRPSGEFIIVGREATWWSATDHKDGAWNCSLFATKESSVRKISDKAYGFSVRCVRD